MKSAMIGLALLVAVSGCKFKDEADRASKIELMSSNIHLAAKIGLRKFLENNEDKTQEIKATIQRVRDILVTHVLPAFGPEANTTKLDFDTFVQGFLTTSELDADVKDLLQLAVVNMKPYIEMPSNPLDSLNPDTKAVLHAGFSALVRAFDDVLAL